MMRLLYLLFCNINFFLDAFSFCVHINYHKLSNLKMLYCYLIFNWSQTGTLFMILQDKDQGTPNKDIYILKLELKQWNSETLFHPEVE